MSYLKTSSPWCLDNRKYYNIICRYVHADCESLTTSSSIRRLYAKYVHIIMACNYCSCILCCYLWIIIIPRSVVLSIGRISTSCARSFGDGRRRLWMKILLSEEKNHLKKWKKKCFCSKPRVVGTLLLLLLLFVAGQRGRFFRVRRIWIGTYCGRTIISSFNNNCPFAAFCF